MGLRRALRDLAKSATEHEAEEVRARSAFDGTTTVSRLKVRQPACVGGTIRAVTLPPIRSVPTLVAEVFDGTGAVNLIFLGRRSVGGIRPGTFVRAEGRVTSVRGRLAIFNPSYEIVQR